jgi:hypothetical protein
MKFSAFKDQDLIFSPAKVDVTFWQQLVSIYFYLANPDELKQLHEEDQKKYYEFIEPFSRFIVATEDELREKGYIVDKEMGAV